MTLLFGPRAVSRGMRRVCLPTALAAPLRIVAGQYARVDVSRSRPGELVVRRAYAPRTPMGRRDPARPRLVTEHGQLSLPVSLMAQVGLGPGNPWVYFAEEDHASVVRIIPAGQVSLMVGKETVDV